jgi:hypothetical protein
MRSSIVVLAAAAALVSAGPARGAVNDPTPAPTIVWMITQLIPSPELVRTRGDSTLGLRWQVTPLLVSYGAQPGVSRLRVLVAEPIVRHSGSTELYFSPEWLRAPGGGPSVLGARVGMRSYFPLAENGDDLSCSLGAAWLRFRGDDAVVWEAGLYTLFGTLGLQASYAPRLYGGTFFGTLSIRYF